MLQGMAAAQAPYFNRSPQCRRNAPAASAERQVEAQTEAEIQIAKRREAEYKEEQFLLKAKKLVLWWSALFREYNENGTFNVKTAREVSKAFHDLEKSEGWPRMHQR